MSGCGRCSAQARAALAATDPYVVLGPDDECLQIDQGSGCRVFSSLASAIAAARDAYGPSGWSAVRATV